MVGDRTFKNINNCSNNNNNMAAIEVQNVMPSMGQTNVADFYNGKNVFITGGTGFMGKVLLEKLLRSCHGVSKIYLIIRPRKGQNAHERLQQLLCSPVSIFNNFSILILLYLYLSFSLFALFCFDIVN